MTPGNNPQHTGGDYSTRSNGEDLELSSVRAPRWSDRSVEIHVKTLQAHDSSIDQQRFAARRLGDSGHPAAVAVLSRTFDDSRSSAVRGECIEALGRLGFPSVIPALLEALHHRDECARWSPTRGGLRRQIPIAELAADQLERLAKQLHGHTQALELELPFAKAPVRERIYRIFGVLGEAPPAVIKDMKFRAMSLAGPDERSACVQSLEAILGIKAVAYFEKLTNGWFSRLHTRQRALLCLGNLVSPECQNAALPILESHLEAGANKPEYLINSREQKASLLAVAAAEALERFAGSGALDLAYRNIGAANRPVDEKLKNLILARSIAGESTYMRLISEIEKPGVSPEHVAAGFSLLADIHLQCPNAIPPSSQLQIAGLVVATLPRDFGSKGYIVYPACTAALGAFGGAATRAHAKQIIGICETGSANVQEYAMRALAEIPQFLGEMVVPLTEILRNTRSVRLLQAACDTVAKLELAATIPVLEGILEDESRGPFAMQSAQRALTALRKVMPRTEETFRPESPDDDFDSAVG